ncbi:MAG TPA: carbohydrate kinase [Bacteroidales bacterium]|nr:carbohydrate kinase [Bacteroidales bacterium]
MAVGNWQKLNSENNKIEKSDMENGLLKEVINRIKDVRIAIVGDFCLDAYWFIDESKSEISIETGEPTMPVKQQKYSLGGAGNVANNLAAMKVKDIRAFGVIGNDPFGVEMIKIMRNAGISTGNMLIQNQKWSTHVYIKPYVGDKEKSRIDFGNFNVLSVETADLLISNLREQADEVDLIIINQQVLSGIHTEYFRKRLVEIIGMFPWKIFIADSRNYTDHYTGAYRKMNDTEASRQCRIQREPDEIIPLTEAKHAAEKLYERYNKPLLITRGSRGSIVINEEGIKEIPGLMILSRVDTVGAGDSYLAGAASALAAGYSPEIAAKLGTLVAGVTVRKLFQTGTASPEEILQTGTDPDYTWRPDLAEDIRQAVYHGNSEIEIINRWPEKLSIKHAVFDNDGTISTLREGWEKIMAPVMVKAILGDEYSGADESLLKKVKMRVGQFIDNTTGIQTLMQMKMLLDIIREFGFVSEDKMLDEFGYKEIYNEELLRMVKEREEKLMAGELNVDDLTIKKAIPFLRRLYDSGVKLYLASGTDIEDVKHEAAVLGHDYMFEGRIYGAVGDLNKEAKKIVLDRILDSIGKSDAGLIVTFGDGPVEIRETQKRGGLTVGIASNELRRYGLNQSKRTRLIKAGTDIIVPDFSQSDLLLEMLNIK